MLKVPDIKTIEYKEQVNNHFSKGLNFYKLFWLFFIGCFLGVVIETIWCLLTRGHYESRVGLIYGPFNLVYGFGVVAMTVGVYWIREKGNGVLLCAGFLIGTLVEYVCSWIQEGIFGSISWNYSAFPLNLNGRVNLLYSIFWGILAVVWVRGIYPFFASWILKIPNRVGKGLTWILVIFMIFNMIMSSLAVERWTHRIQERAEPHKVWTYFDTYYPNEKMEKIYPNMDFK